MNKFNLYKKWLIIDSVLLIFVGLYITFLKETRLFLFDDFINRYFWDEQEIPLEGSIRFLNFLYSLFGVVMIIWGIMMYFLVRHPFSKKEKWAWNVLMISILVWFPIDEFYSLFYGVYFNSIFNIPFLLMILIPLLLSRRAFTSK